MGFRAAGQKAQQNAEQCTVGSCSMGRMFFSGGTHMLHGDGSPVAIFTSAAIAVVIIIGAAVIASLVLL
jgi:hypothetical protein